MSPNAWSQFQRPEQDQWSESPIHLSGLHLLRPATEGHVGVAGAGAIPLLLLDVGDEGAATARFPPAAPVVKHLLDQLVLLLQQQLGLLETDELQAVQGDKIAALARKVSAKLCRFSSSIFRSRTGSERSSLAVFA